MYGGIKKITCNKCDRDISVNNYNKHIITCSGIKKKKIRGIDFDPNFGYKDGSRTAWNKGLKTKPDNRNPDFIGLIGGYRPNAGRSKKYRVNDSFGRETVLQSSYELSCSEILNEMNIKWIRPRALKYDNRNYFADFYLIDYGVYLDPKNNYKAKLDHEKICKVMEQNNVKVIVLLQEQLTKEFIASVIQ